jgi:glycosyltransferase involved in cell wall biosynthesis
LKISVIIPTYKRVWSVCRTLCSLQAQSLSEFEIILVDNAADPELGRRVTEFNPSARVPVRYLAQPNLGVHFARHTGAHAAGGSLLVFTDDDVTFDTGWLQAYHDVFDRHPEMAAAGGPARPFWEAPPPTWLRQYMGDATEVGILSLMEPYREFRLGPEAWFWSLNMAIRREALFAVGGFNPEATGDKWLGDGESGLRYKLRERQMLIGYVPQALVYHHIPLRRLTVDYLCLRLANQEACETYTAYHHRMPPRLGLCKHMLAVALKNCRCLLGAWFVKGRTDSRSLDIQIRAARAWSRLRYTAHLIRDESFRELVQKENWLSDAGDPAAAAT